MLTFTFLPFTPAQQTLLADLYRRGSVLDTVLLRPELPVDNLYTTCQAATQAALDYLNYLDAEAGARLAVGPPEVPPLPVGPLPDPAPVGRLISFAELLGTGYDLEQQQARLFTPHGVSLSHAVSAGLAYALLDPPYSLRVEAPGQLGSVAHTEHLHQRLGELLRGYLATVLHVATPADAQALVCIEWSTDWNPYFEPGHEWWGAFCWTIYDHARATIVVLLASTTD